MAKVTLPRVEALNILLTAPKGRFVGIKFWKRSDGKPEFKLIRVENTPEERLRADWEHGLITVFSETDHGFRRIPVEGIMEMHANGHEYNIVEGV